MSDDGKPGRRPANEPPRPASEGASPPASNEPLPASDESLPASDESLPPGSGDSPAPRPPQPAPHRYSLTDELPPRRGARGSAERRLPRYDGEPEGFPPTAPLVPGDPQLDSRSGRERRRMPRHEPGHEGRRSPPVAGSAPTDPRARIGVDGAAGGSVGAVGQGGSVGAVGEGGPGRGGGVAGVGPGGRAAAETSGDGERRDGGRHAGRSARDGDGRRNRARIAYVVHSLNPGGTERLALDMARTFARAARVSVLCLDEPGVWAPKARAFGVEVHCLWRQPGIDLAVAARIAAFCRRERVDLIHAHQATPWFYSALARLRTRAPRLLFQEHGRFYPEVYSAKRVMLNRLLVVPLTHRVTAVSADVRARLERYEGVPERRTEVVLNGTMAERGLSPAHRAAWRASLGFGPEHRVVGTVGRLDPIKNLPMWIEAFGRASARLPALRGVIVGDGPERAEVERLLRRRGLGERVRLTGHRDDARQMTGIFDVFALASRSEGVSMAILDAMAAGVPVVATAVGGTPEIIETPEQGWLVADEDVQGFADALAEAVRDTDTNRAVGLAGQRRYEAAFTFEDMIERYANLYGEMIGARRPLDLAAIMGTDLR